MNFSTQAILVAAAAAFSGYATAVGAIQLQTPVTYDSGANVIQTVKDECKLEELLVKRVTRVLAKRNALAKKVGSAVDGTASGPDVLKLTIMNVFGVGGGMYSGPKAIALKVELLEGAQLQREQTFSRGSMGGMWGPFKGTCSIFDRVSKRLAQDLGRWLADPAYKAAADDPEKLDDDKDTEANEG